MNTEFPSAIRYQLISLYVQSMPTIASRVLSALWHRMPYTYV